MSDPKILQARLYALSHKEYWQKYESEYKGIKEKLKIPLSPFANILVLFRGCELYYKGNPIAKGLFYQKLIANNALEFTYKDKDGWENGKITKQGQAHWRSYLQSTGKLISNLKRNSV